MDKVQELREQLKNERISRQNNGSSEHDSGTQLSVDSDAPRISSTSTVVEQYSPIERGADQRSGEPATGHIHGIVGALRAIGDTQGKSRNGNRSRTQGNLRTGSTGGRLGESNSQDQPDGDNLSASPTGRGSRKTRQVGNLETDEPIPPRTFKDEDETATNPQAAAFPGIGTAPSGRKRGRPGKQEAKVPTPTPIRQRIAEPAQSGKGPKIPGFLQGSVLSKQEAVDLEEPLLNALTREFDLLDQALWNYAKNTPRGQLQQPIWSDIKEEEMKSLSNILLRLGQKSPTAATVTRVAVDGSDYVTAGMLIAPRFKATVDIIKETRVQRQQEKQLAGRPNVEDRNIRERLRARRTGSGQAS